MKLYSQSVGQGLVDGIPLVILHGLFGTWENWGTQIRRLKQHFPVIGIDLRNHGKSPHAADMTYAAMAEDVRHTLDTLGVGQYHLLGHSMGGKVAMELASRDAGTTHKDTKGLTRLVIVDIAPRLYEPHHDTIIAALNQLDVASLTNRREADDQLRASIPEDAVRLFLLKNLARGEDGRFQWSNNLPAITHEYPNLMSAPSLTGQFAGPALIIRGGLSEYVRESDNALFDQWFVDWTLETISGAGHWPHASHADTMHDLLTGFLDHSRS